MASRYDIQLYEKHKDLIMLIIRLGNKVALQNQLRALCLRLKLYKSTEHFNSAIRELKEGKMIEFYGNGDYRNSKSNLIVIINPTLSLAYKELKDKGILINKAKIDLNKNISDRSDKSIFKIQYAINYVKNKDIESTDKLFELLEKDSSILFSEKRGLEYFNSFVNHYKNYLYIQDNECTLIRSELTRINQKQKKSVPSRLGKGKDFKAEKDKDIYIDYTESKDTPQNIKNIYTPDKEKETDNGNLDDITNKKFENNFNSFLDRACILKLSKVNSEMQGTDVYMKSRFKLYILDINKKLNYIKIAEKTSRAYLMIQNFLENGCEIRDSRKCQTCKKNVNNQNFELISRNSNIYVPKTSTDKTSLMKAYYHCNPFDENNNDYISCTDNKVRLRRGIYFDVIVLTWNEDRKKELLTQCNYIKEKNYFNDNYANTEFQKVCKNEGLYEKDLEKINLRIVDYNLEQNYCGGKSINNINKKNAKASLKKEIKDNIKNSQMNLEEYENSVVLDDASISKLADIIVNKILDDKKD